jgi:transposase-like protein/IS1 family transposase
VVCHRCQIQALKFGFNPQGLQRYRCKQCGKTFSDIPARPLDDLRIAPKRAYMAIQLLCEGTGIRATERLTGLNRRTVLGILETAGQKCARLSDDRIRNVAVESFQCDELYAFVFCKEAHNEMERADVGEQYTYLAVDRKTKLILSYHTGKRTPENTNAFMLDVRKRVNPGCQLTTDGYKCYLPAVNHAFGQNIHFAQQTKVYADAFPMPKRLRHELQPQGVKQVSVLTIDTAGPCW